MISFQSLVLLLWVLVPFTLASSQLRPRAASYSLCGVKGYDHGVIAYGYEKSSDIATIAKCGARCAQDSNCKSFAFGAKECLLYDVSLYVKTGIHP